MSPPDRGAKLALLVPISLTNHAAEGQVHCMACGTSRAGLHCSPGDACTRAPCSAYSGSGVRGGGCAQVVSERFAQVAAYASEGYHRAPEPGDINYVDPKTLGGGSQVGVVVTSRVGGVLTTPVDLGLLQYYEMGTCKHGPMGSA